MVAFTQSQMAQLVLGKQSDYRAQYGPAILLPIARQAKRDEIGIAAGAALPFYGFDVWNHYEVSWLGLKGKPMVALAKIVYDCASQNIIESKSMKLYFNSFNNAVFEDERAVQAAVYRDLAERLQTPSLAVQITPLKHVQDQALCRGFSGTCIDELDVTCSVYHADPHLLATEATWVEEETLWSDLLKSNCLVTGQPDWCSLQIIYRGKKINRESLLRYLVSFRNDDEFHEPCIEKIFIHLMRHCRPESLTVHGRSTRRGGIDINAVRSTRPVTIADIVNPRLCRQ
jgi:7-cyano-7-deazaguanine reductase